MEKSDLLYRCASIRTPNMEYILGETDNDREYRQGDEVSYIYHAEYAYTLQEALDWLNNVN